MVRLRAKVRFRDKVRVSVKVRVTVVVNGDHARSVGLRQH